MILTHITSIALAATFSTTAAWRLQLYDKPEYKDIVYTYTGDTIIGCHELPAKAKDKAESFHWYSNGFDLQLYADDYCKSYLGNSCHRDWHKKTLSSKAKNNIASWCVGCNNLQDC